MQLNVCLKLKELVSSNAEKKILKGDVRALKYVCGKNASGKGVNFTFSAVFTIRNHVLQLQQGSKGELGQDIFSFFLKRSTEIDFGERISSTGSFKGQSSVRHPHPAEGQGHMLHGLSKDCFSSVFCDSLLTNKVKLYSQHRSVWLSRQYFFLS